MIQAHPSFKKPTNLGQTIWRYLDFTKFVDLLYSQELFFSRADLFNDPFEGSIPIVTYADRKQSINSMIEKGTLLPKYKDAEALAEGSKAAVRSMFNNCWHVNDHESAAMWKLYLKTNEGICIQSKFNLLEESLKGDANRIFLGLVNYIDYETEMIDWGNVLNPFVHKRKSFEHERELRALIWESKLSSQLGIRVKINPAILISNIYVCLDSPTWFKTIVVDITRRFGLDVPIVQSELARDPIY
jgi:hypothetical protein